MTDQPFISVIVPIYRQQAALDRTLESLARQDYASYEIVVVDDGSETPITAPDEIDGTPIRLVRQPRDGFGLARARNTGAAAARGDVFIFLDCDMIPVGGFVSAHVRHHVDHDHAVVIGFRGHVDGQGLSPEAVRKAAERGDVAALFAERKVDYPTWIEQHWKRTDDLRSAHHDKWRAMSGGNLSVRKTLWALIGGADAAFRQWGGEDNETAYRLLAAGADPFVDRGAFAWHQGEGHEPSESEKRSLREQQARLEQLITDPTMRRPRSGRIFENPQTVLRLRSAGWDDTVADSVIRSVLVGSETDARVEVEVPASAVWLRRRHSDDPRVVFVDQGSASVVRFPFLRVTLPEPWGFGSGTLDVLVGAVRSGETGTVRVLLGESEMVARLQRVESRLDRLRVEDRDDAARGFGDLTMLADDLGMQPVGGGEQWERGSPVRRPSPHIEARVEKARRRFGRR